LQLAEELKQYWFTTRKPIRWANCFGSGGFAR
jgi:hypothetical protein